MLCFAFLLDDDVDVKEGSVGFLFFIASFLLLLLLVLFPLLAPTLLINTTVQRSDAPCVQPSIRSSSAADALTLPRIPLKKRSGWRRRVRREEEKNLISRDEG